MKVSRLISGMLGAAVLWAGVSEAASSIVELKSCPAAVQKTIQAKAGENKIVSITKSVEDGDVEFEVAIGQGKQKRGFTVADDGSFLGWDDNKLELTDCPAAVQKTIKENAVGATVQEIEDFTDEFVATIKKGAKESKLYITETGDVRMREDQVELASCPEAVRKTIQQKAGKNKIVSITKITTSLEDEDVEYEVTVLRGKLERTFTVADDGEFGEWSSEFVELKACPPAVQDAIKKHLAGATIDGIEDSVEEFAVNLTKGDQEKWLRIAADGTVQSLDEIVALASCPEAVQKTIQTKAAGAKVQAVYKVTAGQTIKYIATIEGKEGERDCDVAPDGNFLGWEDEEEN